jgi:hypothetical protein
MTENGRLTSRQELYHLGNMARQKYLLTDPVTRIFKVKKKEYWAAFRRWKMGENPI